MFDFRFYETEKDRSCHYFIYYKQIVPKHHSGTNIVRRHGLVQNRQQVLLESTGEYRARVRMLFPRLLPSLMCRVISNNGTWKDSYRRNNLTRDSPLTLGEGWMGNGTVSRSIRHLWYNRFPLNNKIFLVRGLYFWTSNYVNSFRWLVLDY